jgi:hypothetical protein
MDVESSMIRSITWRRQVLKVTFQSGTVYHYALVPKDIYNAFLASESKGRYFNSHIKYQYAYRRAK